MGRDDKGPRLSSSARRAQLVDIGRKVFAQRGYEAASVEEIAERAKISKPIVYEHFGGKEGLYAVVVDREIEHIVTCIVDAISVGTPRERLEQAALAFLRYVKERPEGFAMLLRDAPASKRTGEMPALMYDLADRVGAIFTDQFRKAGYDAKAAPIYAHALVGMVAFVGQWWTESSKPPAVETVASHIAALAWMGLRHLPKKPTLTANTEKKR
ncbi:MAG TPA: TetR/AcrR family transcriptional regulator [Candidatus Limnocylindrales bacterium]|nr:TetR/AcrR family transcriptional regulator [Candidatus Limnocylindrales bacterium]